jgi:hypothetical protein
MPGARREHTHQKLDLLVIISGPSRSAPAGAPSGIGAAFRSCESYLTAGLRRMQDRGELDAGSAHGVLALVA